MSSSSIRNNIIYQLFKYKLYIYIYNWLVFHDIGSGVQWCLEYSDFCHACYSYDIFLCIDKTDSI